MNHDLCFFSGKTINFKILTQKQMLHQSFTLRIFEALNKENKMLIINIFFCLITQNNIINATIYIDNFT